MTTDEIRGIVQRIREGLKQGDDYEILAEELDLDDRQYLEIVDYLLTTA
jgi:hypothetical protein